MQETSKIVSEYTLIYNNRGTTGFVGRVPVELEKDRTVARIISRLCAEGPKALLRVEGNWGSFARLLAAYISKKLRKPILYICPHIDDADNAAEDLHTFGAREVLALPAWEGEETFADATDEIGAERLRVAMQLLSNGKDLVIPTSIQALCQPIPNPEVVRQNSLHLAVNTELSPEKIIEWLIEHTFESVEKVDLPGQFARRGGILDIYAPLIGENVLTEKTTTGTKRHNSAAVRVEFFGDTIESIRQIDLDTQHSSRQIQSVEIISAGTGDRTGQNELFINLLPVDSIIILEEPADIEQVAQTFLNRLYRTDGFYTWRDIHRAMGNFTQVHICRFASSADEFLRLNVSSVQQYQRQSAGLWTGPKAALQQLLQQAKQGKKVLLYCDSQAEIRRLGEIAKETAEELPTRFKLVHGFVHKGFAINSLETIVITHHELFGQYALLRRRYRPSRPSAPIDTLEDLQPGDYVVHTSYGIGRFRGIKTIKEKGRISEYLTIEYADGVNIQVSVDNIALVQKFIGTSPRRPKLSKIGSKKWQRQKEKVARSVQDLALELLEIQARRQTLGGIAYGPDSDWQRQFDESFPYTETPDQTNAMEQIKADMQQPIAMDRLLCGDVGYGKTELAMRAAFKAVENGKQVAVLAPTTVLCVQHVRTFTERFADFPICIEALNRFKTPKEARDIIERTRAGKVDILIGTHRLLSDDVGFKDLGLLIIDEEQRFGVAHKEKLKKLRVNVDILTMTATPIPRTLHMALLGLRDISSLATPPLDRRSIVTSVASYNAELIKRAIYRELNRRGQVFFVHNRVKTIDKKAWEIQKLVPDARVAVAHGQMPKTELEQTMIDFVLGKVEVLTCTTIIESGLDIPNANTIFIDEADRFGLAELHQLRGRVGRYKHRAYAYLLLPASRPITPVAARRLKAIEEYSHLGAGFRIALRDLEIRGAGNILGPEQSGHIQTVGYQMYCELLAEAVRRLRNEPTRKPPAVTIDLGFTTYIPRNYIPFDRQRMDVYRKIAVAGSIEDLRQIETELRDVYGPLPEEVGLMLEMAGLRILAAKRRIKSIVKSGQNLIFSFSGDGNGWTKLFSNIQGKITVQDTKTVYLRLPATYFEPPTLLSVLRKILSGDKE